MPWQSPGNYTPSDFLHSDDLNKLHQDDVTWGGDVNGGGYTLSNVTLVGVKGLATGNVTSVFGRTGDVIAVAGDYTAAQVGAVPTARQVIAGAGMSGGGALTGDVTLTALVTSVFGRTGAITLTPADITGATGVLNTRKVNTGLGLSGGGALSADLNLAVVPDTVNQQVQVLSGATLTGTRHAINFVNGANVTVGIVDNPTANRVDVTISSTGGSGGMVDPTTTKGDVIVRGLTVPNRLAVGADGQVLTADSTQAVGVKWATPSGGGAVASVFNRTGAVVAAAGDYTAAQVTNAVDSTVSYNNPAWITTLPWSKITNPPAFMLDPTLAAGDLIVHGTTTTRLPVGADGSILTADSTQTAGMRWGTLPVTSVFGRAGGAVTAQAGDYTVAQVTGAVASTRNINTSTGLTGGGNLSADRTFSVVADTTNQQVQVLLGGTVIGTRHAINFVSGAGVALTITDDPTDNRINLTVASSGTGSGGGLVDPTTTKGDLIVRGATAPPQALSVGANGQVLTADNSQPLGMAWTTPTGGGAGSQTPWQSDINAALWSLNFVKSIGVNVTSAPTTARILIEPSAAEEGVKTVISAAPGLASMSVVNDIGDYLRVRSYGSGYAPNPPEAGLTALESSTTLAIFASAAEAMRLIAGPRILIGTTADDGLNTLQVHGTVKSASGGFVFPDGTTQTTAYTSASSPVTSVFGRTGAVLALANDYTAAKVTNAVDQTAAYANPAWITSLAWSKITGAPAAVTQTPWTQNINAATFWLYSAGRIGVGNDATVIPDTSSSNTHLIVGPTTAASSYGELTVCTDTTTLGAQVGNLQFANYSIAAADKRIAAISAFTDGAANSGAMQFFTWNAGALAERMRITSAGNVGIGNPSPSALLSVRKASAGFAPFTGSQIFSENAGAPSYIEAACAGVGDSCGYLFSSGGSLTSYIIDLNSNWSFVSAARPVLFNIGGAERMRITTAGLVGIGVTAPTCALQVFGNNGTDGISAFFGLDASHNGIAIGNNASIGFIEGISSPTGTHQNIALNPNGGFVGIGTTAPAYALDVVGSVHASGTFGTTTCGNLFGQPQGSAQAISPANAGVKLYDFGSGNWAGMGCDTGGNMWIRTGTSGTPDSRLTVMAASGFVGIGVTVPQSMLSVIQTPNPTSAATATQFTIGESTNNPQYHLSLGYYPGADSQYHGVIQSLNNGGGSALFLNPGGGAVNIGAGNASTSGDLGVARNAAPGTGVIYFGNSGNSYLYFDGTNFNFAGGGSISTGGGLSVSAGASVTADLQVQGRHLGPSAALSAPILYCPPFTGTDPSIPVNTMVFTYNQSSNYVTLWVKMADGSFHIASFTLTTAP
jgi:hypothetical protein